MSAPPSDRPGCPRCGRPMGRLGGGPDAEADAPSRWYCGCCGVVLDAPG